eukprot:scaffold1581_cov169-Amphora_coffeaeformis.AAC.20
MIVVVVEREKSNKHQSIQQTFASGGEKKYRAVKHCILYHTIFQEKAKNWMPTEGYHTGQHVQFLLRNAFVRTRGVQVQCTTSRLGWREAGKRTYDMSRPACMTSLKRKF